MFSEAKERTIADCRDKMEIPAYNQKPVPTKDEGRASDKDGDPRPHWADRIIAIFTGLIFLTYIGSNYFACQQMKLTKRAIEQAERGNTASIAAQQGIAQNALTKSQENLVKSSEESGRQFTKVLGQMEAQTAAQERAAGATKSAAKTAGDTLTSSKEQFRTDQRPYLFGFPRATKMKDGSPTVMSREKNGEVGFYVGVDVQNVGKSPAQDVLCTPSWTKAGSAVEVTKWARDFVPQYTNPSPIVITMNTSVTVHTPGVPGGPTITLNDEEFAQFQKETLAVYVVGACRYKDIFNPPATVPYEMGYCIRLLPIGMSFGECPFGNYTK